MRFVFIRAEKANYPVSALCRVLRVSRSGFYAWCTRRPSARAAANQQLVADIREVHARSKKRYGSPRVHAELAATGQRIGRKRVARLMRQQGICALQKRRFRVTTDSDHALPVAPNLLKRQFRAERVNQAWVGDVTYLRTHQGWLYLAVLLDLCSRRVVGWSMSADPDRDLVLSALEMAIEQRTPPPGLVHHTDRGCQYASREYREALTEAGIVCSMSRKGNCWDNAVAESFFATLRRELTDHVVFLTRDAARLATFEFIEGFYNRHRRHSTLDYVSPLQFEAALVRTGAA